MHITLKQAAQQAIDAFEAFGEADDFGTLFTLTQKMNALRTAIQQAEAKTDEPVAWLYIEDGEVMFGHPNGYRPPDARPLVFGDTHPAPGVPDTLKDHQIAAMVNTLRDIARQFHGHDSLRERIANVLVPALKAEAKQPATSEPVVWNSIQIASWIGSQLMHEPSMFDRSAVCKFVRSLGRHPTLLKHSPSTHSPATPGVSDDSKRLDYLQDRGANIDLIPGVADFYPMQFRVGGLHASANTDVRAAIDAAMLAASS